MITERFNGHTPGPWREILDQGSEDFNGWDELQEMGFNDEARALIAAAPDLLAALVSVLSTRDKQRERSTRLRKEVKRLTEERDALLVKASQGVKE
tara:strand:- start:38 stop:325 length:288 start_codon:yes stop_codon:yes gene_type:complete